jgi:hypothetical protein
MDSKSKKIIFKHMEGISELGRYMDSKSKNIIFRHLKGIVNELEKDLKREKELEQIKVYVRQVERTP